MAVGDVILARPTGPAIRDTQDRWRLSDRHTLWSEDPEHLVTAPGARGSRCSQCRVTWEPSSLVPAARWRTRWGQIQRAAVADVVVTEPSCRSRHPAPSP